MFAKFGNMLVEKERNWRSSFGFDISTPEARKRSRTHFLYVDHGILRMLWHNFHKLDADAYRSNQPDQKRIKNYAAKGIVAILSLRGTSRWSHHLFEDEACREHGLSLQTIRFSALRLPLAEEILALEEIFREIPKPFLLHCKSGADRAGFASALYLMLIKNQPLEVALKQLSMRYLHFKNSKTGILDYFFECYRLDNQAAAISLHDWVATVYDRDKVTKDYRAGRPPVARSLT